jgi:hypothetical protein
MVHTHKSEYIKISKFTRNWKLLFKKIRDVGKCADTKKKQKNRNCRKMFLLTYNVENFPVTVNA